MESSNHYSSDDLSSQPLYKLGQLTSAADDVKVANADALVSRVVDGVVVYGDEIFTVSGGSSTVAVFSAVPPYGLVRAIDVEGLRDPTDVAACTDTARVFVADLGGHCVWAIDVASDVAKRWNGSSQPDKTDDNRIDPVALSVTEGRLLVADGERARLALYDANGQRKCIVTVKSAADDEEVVCVFHAAELQRGTAVVSYRVSVGDSRESDRIGVVNLKGDGSDTGNVLRFFQGEPTSSFLAWPVRVIPVGPDRVLVVDRDHERVIVLGIGALELNFERVLQTLDAGCDLTENTGNASEDDAKNIENKKSTGGTRLVALGPRPGQIIVCRSASAVILGVKFE